MKQKKIEQLLEKGYKVKWAEAKDHNEGEAWFFFYFDNKDAFPPPRHKVIAKRVSVNFDSFTDYAYCIDCDEFRVRTV